MYFSLMAPLFEFLAYEFLKRETMFLIAKRMFACAFKRYPDFVLKKVLNPDSHRYFVTNGMSTASAVHSLRNIAMAEHLPFQSFTLKLHFEGMI